MSPRTRVQGGPLLSDAPGAYRLPSRLGFGEITQLGLSEVAEMSIVRLRLKKPFVSLPSGGRSTAVIVLEGETEVLSAEGLRIGMTPGRLHSFPGGIVERRSPGGQIVRLLVLHFAPDSCPELASSELDLLSMKLARSIVEAPLPGPGGGTDISARLRAQAAGLNLLAGLLEQVRASDGDEPSLADDWVARAHRILLADLGRPPSLPTLARAVGVSHPKLNRAFRARYGASVFELLRSERLARAEQLLVDGDQSLSAIAYTLGFSSPSHFSTAFGRAYGVTPGAFRRSRDDIPPFRR